MSSELADPGDAVAPRAHPAPGAAWQREDLVASFAERRRVILPLLDVQEDVVRKLLARHGRKIERFLDLGCGAGAMSELVLAAAGAHPPPADARAAAPPPVGVLVDFSEPMLTRAGDRLALRPGGWQTVQADLNSPAWREALPAGRYDVVISGLAIHHLPPERKPKLFAEVLDLLEPGGMFINMDYVTVAGPLAGLFDEQMLANAVHAEHAAGGTRSEAELDLGDDDDRPDTVEDQLRWLRDAGFHEVEVHFKWAEAAIFGGMRPAV